MNAYHVALWTLTAISVACAIAAWVLAVRMIMGTRQLKASVKGLSELNQQHAAALEASEAIYAKAAAANQRALENWPDPNFEHTPEEKTAILEALLQELKDLDTSPHGE